MAGLIERCLREVNSRDYPKEVIERMCDHFTEQRINELAIQRQMFVAEANGIAGTVSRDGNKVYTMFVDPPGRRSRHRTAPHAPHRGAGGDRRLRLSAYGSRCTARYS
ncbi:hypothetical protein [Micromonospora vulcania]|uniref:Uncharacterized protein n=1 Tax=Micromonospora vulcania TaxID=1441873 RepID=A0ABW1H3E6_9ACTN